MLQTLLITCQNFFLARAKFLKQVNVLSIPDLYEVLAD